MKLRIGIKGNGWFPNAGIFVVAVKNKETGDSIIEAFGRLKAAVLIGAGREFSDRMVCEWR